MMSSEHGGVTVLWSAEAGAATRELRITRKTLTTLLLLASVAVALCGWMGWQLGHWSAKEDARAKHAGATQLVAELAAHEVRVAR